MTLDKKEIEKKRKENLSFMCDSLNFTMVWVYLYAHTNDESILG